MVRWFTIQLWYEETGTMAKEFALSMGTEMLDVPFRQERVPMTERADLLER